MKKLIIFITATTVFCFCAVLIQAQNNTMINSIKQLERSDANCTLFLNQVLNTNKNLDMFENEVEHFLETSSFWETCFVDQLKNYQDIIINYTGYTKFVPTKKELKYLIKSAVKFKEEFKDCIKQKIFKRFVILSNRNGPMTYEGIFDENFKCLWIS